MLPQASGEGNLTSPSAMIIHKGTDVVAAWTFLVAGRCDDAERPGRWHAALDVVAECAARVAEVDLLCAPIVPGRCGRSHRQRIAEAPRRVPSDVEGVFLLYASWSERQRRGRRPDRGSGAGGDVGAGAVPGAGMVALLLWLVLVAVVVVVAVVVEVVSLVVEVVLIAGTTGAGAPTADGAAIVVGIAGLPAIDAQGETGPSSMYSMWPTWPNAT